MSYSFEEKLKYGKFKTLNEVHDAFVEYKEENIGSVEELEKELSDAEERISDIEADLKDAEADFNQLKEQCRALIREIEYCINELSEDNRKDVQKAIEAIEE